MSCYQGKASLRPPNYIHKPQNHPVFSLQTKTTTKEIQAQSIVLLIQTTSEATEK